ncbi:MAG: NAD(P)/FAD-dependent oxidoreductase, partial [Thermoplasmataceae archaeon]
MDRKYDVIVIGAGISGLSTALHVKELNKDLRILVVDRQNSYGQGNTGKSAAGFRDVFRTDINRQLASTSIEFFRDIQKTKGVDLGMRDSGYLFLVRENSQSEGILQELSGKTKIEVVQKDEIKASLNINYQVNEEQKKLMNLENYDLGYLGRNCGIIEPELVADYYYNACLKIGIEFQFRTDVESISLVPVNPLDYPGEPFIWQDKKVSSIKTSRGNLLADEYILAADVYTTGLLDRTGIDGHERPKKRQVFQLTNDKIVEMLGRSIRTDENVMPFTILPSHGIFMRPAPKYKSMWIGVADDLA